VRAGRLGRPQSPTKGSTAEERLLRFQEHYEAIAQPFEWRFTRFDLLALLTRLEEQQFRLPMAA
jgi:hypothetical protein